MTASIRGPVSDAKELTECKRLSLKRGNPRSRRVAAAAGQPTRNLLSETTQQCNALPAHSEDKTDKRCPQRRVSS